MIFRELWLQIATVSFAAGVIGNIVAAVIWGVPAWLHLHRKLDRHHKRVLTALGVDDDAACAAGPAGNGSTTAGTTGG